MSADCIFCAIVAGESPAARVYEDDRVVAFKDVNAITDVHLLVVPREHVISVDELSDNDDGLAGHLLLTAKNLGHEHSPEHGYRIFIAGGGQEEVKHLHVHVLGGHADLGWPAKNYKGVSKS